MNTINCYGRMLACMAAIGMLASPLLGASPVPVSKQAKPAIFDIRLADGALVGQVVNSAGKPEQHKNVVLLSKLSPVSKSMTDEAGRFKIPVSKQGAYRVMIADRAFSVRAWSPEAAPPASRDSLLCVVQDTLRGQCDCGSMGDCAAGMPCDCDSPACCPAPCQTSHSKVKAILCNPAIIGLGVAAAIALPIALDDDDDAS